MPSSDEVRETWSRSATLVNDASSRAPLLSLTELYAWRDLLRFLVWRQLQMRYRHTLIGVGWTVLNPLVTMAVFGLIVPHLIAPATLRAETLGIPYAVYVYAGLVPWTCFSHALTRANTSLLDQASLLKNMYFPRVMLPLSNVLAALAELLLACVALGVVMAILSVPPSVHIVALPLFLLLMTMTSLGVGLFLAMVYVRYRDVLFLAQYALQLGLLVTPVWFSPNALPTKIRWIVALNPMAAVVQGFRWSVLGVDPPSVPVVATSAAVSAGLVLLGLWYFRGRQEVVADYV